MHSPRHLAADRTETCLRALAHERSGPGERERPDGFAGETAIAAEINEFATGRQLLNRSRE